MIIPVPSLKEAIMRAFLTVWLLTAVTQSRFNAESPLIINKMITEGDSTLTSKKIEFLDQLLDVHEYEASIISLNFDIKGEKIDIRAAGIISKLLEEKNSQLLALKNCFLSSESLKSIMSSALWKSKTRCLVIHNCRLGFDAISSHLNHNYSHLSGKVEEQDGGKEKKLKRRKFDGKKIQKEISEGTGKGRDDQENEQNVVNDNLSLLDVSFNNLDSYDIKQLSILIKSLKNLKVLVLDGNKIALKDLQILLGSVQSHSSMHHISLSDCGLTDECMEYINFCFKMNRNITSIDLSSNKLTSQGMYVLTEGFRGGGGRKLESLDISYNSIGDLGIQALANSISLGQLPILKNLILKEVDATTISLEKLFYSFPYGSLLEVIDISGNDLLQTKKNKKTKTGYNPKNLKKRILSFTPQITNVMKTFSGAIKLKIESAGKIVDSQKDSFIKMTKTKKSKSYGGKKLLKSKIVEKIKISKTNKISKKTKDNKLNLNLIDRKSLKKGVGKKKILMVPTMTKNMILSEDKLLEKSRIRTIRSVLHTLRIARNLKKIVLVKVGLTDLSCILFKQEFDKKVIIDKNIKNKSQKNDVTNREEKQSKNEIVKETDSSDKNEKINTNINENENLFSKAPQIIISDEIPEIITSIDDILLDDEMDKDIDSLIYKHVHVQPKENIFKDFNDKKNDDNMNIYNINSIRKRKIQVLIYLNELSIQSTENLIELFQIS